MILTWKLGIEFWGLFAAVLVCFDGCSKISFYATVHQYTSFRSYSLFIRFRVVSCWFVWYLLSIQFTSLLLDLIIHLYSFGSEPNPIFDLAFGPIIFQIYFSFLFLSFSGVHRIQIYHHNSSSDQSCYIWWSILCSESITLWDFWFKLMIQI